MTNANGKGTRTLWVWLGLFTALVMLLVISAMPYVRQYKAVQWVEAQGGLVQTEEAWVSARLPSAATDWFSDKGWLVNVQRVTYVDLAKTQVGDVGLEHLKGLTTLQRLYLSHTQVNDAGLEHLKDMTALQRLLLSDTRVTTPYVRLYNRLQADSRSSTWNIASSLLTLPSKRFVHRRTICSIMLSLLGQGLLSAKGVAMAFPSPIYSVSASRCRSNHKARRPSAA